jgi:hypothetical protein
MKIMDILLDQGFPENRYPTEFGCREFGATITQQKGGTP